MSTRPDLDRSIAEWLVAEVPDRAPERLLEASRDRIRTTSQRPAWWPAWRVPPVNNTVRIIAAVAAVAVVAVIGYQFLFGAGVGEPGPSPSSLGEASLEPSAAPSASAPAAGPTNFTEMEGEGTALEPGEYVIDYAAPVATVTFTVPDEPYNGEPSPWYKALFDWGPWHQNNAGRLGVADVENLFVDPCDPVAGLRDPAVGPGVADLVAALSDVPGLVVSEATDATISGYSGQLVELTGEVPAVCVEDRAIWLTTRGDPSLLLPGTGDFNRVWILDVEGERLVIWASEDGDFDQQEALQALVDTIVIEAP
jgi:hypothetical protein